MTCRELVELLIDYVSGDMPADGRDRVTRHLSDCPPCVAYLETYQHIIRLTRKLPSPQLPAELAARLRRALADVQATPPRSESPGDGPSRNSAWA